MGKHQLTDNVKLLQKVALVHAGKVLLLRRTADAYHRPSAWDLPGGNSEWPDVSESEFGLHRKDAAREVLEETSIRVAAEKFDFEKLVYFETYFDLEHETFAIITGWRLELPNDDEISVTISDEHVEYVWADLENLDSYDFGGEKGEFVKTIASARK